MIRYSRALSCVSLGADVSDEILCSSNETSTLSSSNRLRGWTGYRYWRSHWVDDIAYLWRLILTRGILGLAVGRYVIGLTSQFWFHNINEELLLVFYDSLARAWHSGVASPEYKQAMDQRITHSWNLDHQVCIPCNGTELNWWSVNSLDDQFARWTSRSLLAWGGDLADYISHRRYLQVQCTPRDQL